MCRNHICLFCYISCICCLSCFIICSFTHVWKIPLIATLVYVNIHIFLILQRGCVKLLKIKVVRFVYVNMYNFLLYYNHSQGNTRSPQTKKERS